MFEFSRSLGNAVRDARNQQGLTQNQVADIVGMDSRTILNIENFKGNPKMEILYPLIRSLRINPNGIFYPEIERAGPMREKLNLLVNTCSEQEAESLISVCESILAVLRSRTSTCIK